MKKRLFSLALALLLCLLPGCGQKGSLPLRADFDSQILSLDPQFATDQASRVVLCNIMEGLLVRQPDGTLAPGAAERYTVSADGLTYTFYLRQDGVWNNEDKKKGTPPTPVTAQDFVFAFRRMFHSQVPSPYCGDFAVLLHSAQVLAGELPPQELGVRAVDDYTLVFTLEKPSPVFLQNLAGVGAFPCNQEFFDSTRARYGLELQYLLSNGPFYLSRWNQDLLLMEKNSTYHHSQEVICPSVTFYTSRVIPQERTDEKNKATSAWDLFLSQKSDYVQASYQQIQQLDRKKFVSQPFDDTVWALVFRETGALANADVRRALALSIDFSGFQGRVPEQFTLTKSLIPDSVTLSGSSYRTLAGEVSRRDYAPQEAAVLLEQGLAQLSLTQLPHLTLILPRSADLGDLGGYLQKVWQQDLRQFINLELLPEEEYQKRLAQGEYDLAVQRLTAAGGDPGDTISAFSSGTSANITGGSDPELDSLLAQAVSAPDPQVEASLFAGCERRILDQAAAVPFFTQSNYYAISKNVSGIQFSANGVFFYRASRQQ